MLLGGVLIFTTLIGGAKTVEFTAASLNVDGMPPSLLGGIVKLNPDAKEGAGAKAIGEGIASKGWDIIALSEDFNYHSELMEPLSNYYNAGTHRGKLTNKIDVLTSPFDTDGLGFLWGKNKATVSGESWTMWNTRNGKTDQGSDELIKKGFRYYCVDFGNGLSVDVYIHHMDAETGEADNAARESQIAQLVDVILASNNKRPIIIMGDTNCRYTRDNLKELLFKRINDDPRFTIQDPWIEFNYAGNYDDPVLQVGQGSLMVDALGYGKGEVVDKIFYINNTDADGTTLRAESYTSATDFTSADGQPLSDHYPVVAKFVLENPNAAIDGTAYYLLNKATGKYLRAGGSRGFHTWTGETGMPITIERGTATGKWYFKNPCGYLKLDQHLDGAESAKDEMTLSQNGDYINIAYSDGKMLTANADGSVTAEDANANSDNQKWTMLTKAAMIEHLRTATADSPVDATYLIRGYDFWREPFDDEYSASENSYWTVKTEKRTTISFGGPNSATESWFNCDIYNSKKGTFDTSKSDWSIGQEISGLPNGKYVLTFNALTSTSEVTAVVTASSDYSQTLTQSSFDINSDLNERHKASFTEFAKGTYGYTFDNIIVNNGNLKFQLSHGNNTSVTWTALGDLKLTYYGPTEEMQAGYNLVKAAMDDVAAKLQNLSVEAQLAYQNKTVEQAYESKSISGDGHNEVRLTYEALAAAAKQQTEAPADMTYAITNWSFEMGYMTEIDRAHPYWQSTWADDTKVAPNSDGTYHCDNADGDYLFNTWGDNKLCLPVYHDDITGLPNGIYEVSALLTSDPGNTVFLLANDQQSEPVNPVDKATFSEAKVKVVITDGKLKIGAVGGNNGVCDPTNGGNWFKADNFRLSYIGNIGNIYVQKAIDNAQELATAKNVDVDLQKFQDMVDNNLVEGDGTAEIVGVYTALGNAEKANAQAGSDMTDAIINPSFELVELGLWPFTGWNITIANDTKVLNPNSEANAGTYGVSPVDGNNVVNTWDGDDRGYPLSQTLTGLPVGQYILRAMVASYAGNHYFLAANGQHSEPVVTTDKGTFQEIELHFTVVEGDDEVTIGLYPSASETFDPEGNGPWYKADNFRLTYETASETTYTLVTSFNQLETDCKYVITAEHPTDGHHALGKANDDGSHAGVPVAVQDDKVIVTGSVVVFTIKKEGSNIYLVDSNGSYLSAPAVSRSISSEPAPVSLKVENGQPTVTVAGRQLGFDNATKTFGFADEHSEPLELYTTATGENGNLSGVESLENDVVEEEYFNLQGQKVENPAGGIFIVKKGNQASKRFFE